MGTQHFFFLHQGPIYISSTTAIICLFCQQHARPANYPAEIIRGADHPVFSPNNRVLYHHSQYSPSYIPNPPGCTKGAVPQLIEGTASSSAAILELMLATSLLEQAIC
ncbi:Hypothetical predicted protein [Pelobates cultripes]|uniref:Uncharacterized protein n=1 Tax=Pelobates cultripes TaxID=61616 RepID=A0AAD1T8B4_PELCU|nr:Hypothetical predicted protein [Pelobates cultripes]